MLTRLALGNPGVAFRLQANDRITLWARPAASQLERVAEIFGREEAERLVPFGLDIAEGLAVSGFFARPPRSSRNSRDLHILVNRRWVRCLALARAIGDAFQGALPAREYPFAIVNLDLDPARVDVNVHPAKEEVRFEQERLVIGGVTQAIRRALSGLAGLPTFLSLAATAGKGGKTTGHSRAAVPGGGDLRNRAGPGGGEAESEEVRQHLFEDIDPGFAAKAANGGGVAGGENFGCGSAREQGLTALKYAGIGLVVCKSFSRAFYRNGINNAVALFIADCPEPMGEIAQAGDELEADFTGGTLRNLSRNREFACSPAPAFIAEVLRAGGIYEYYAANGFQAAKG